jgi:hypothetical protein
MRAGPTYGRRIALRYRHALCPPSSDNSISPGHGHKRVEQSATRRGFRRRSTGYRAAAGTQNASLRRSHMQFAKPDLRFAVRGRNTALSWRTRHDHPRRRNGQRVAPARTISLRGWTGSVRRSTSWHRRSSVTLGCRRLIRSPVMLPAGTGRVSHSPSEVADIAVAVLRNG